VKLECAIQMDLILFMQLCLYFHGNIVSKLLCPNNGACWKEGQSSRHCHVICWVLFQYLKLVMKKVVCFLAVKLPYFLRKFYLGSSL
jgi:hypothetical protein